MALGWHKASFQGAGKVAWMLWTSTFFLNIAVGVELTCVQSLCMCLSGPFAQLHLIGWRWQLFGWLP